MDSAEGMRFGMVVADNILAFSAYKGVFRVEILILDRAFVR